MASLVALLSSGKGTWGEVYELLNVYDWSKVFIVTSDFGVENFSKRFDIKEKESIIEFVVVDFRRSEQEIVNELKKAFNNKLSMDIAVNFASGTGKEHMCLLSALLQQGVGIRLVTVKKGRLIELQGL